MVWCKPVNGTTQPIKVRGFYKSGPYCVGEVWCVVEGSHVLGKETIQFETTFGLSLLSLPPWPLWHRDSL